MKAQQFSSIWDALEDNTDEAENLKLRAQLMMALEQHIRRASLSQAEAAAMLCVSQPRVSDLLRGKIELFSLDMLVNMAARAGLHVQMKIRKAA